MNKNVIVVGGGIAGLTAAIYLARGGAKVTIFDKRRFLGGRAITHLRHGFRFNLGPHAVYRAGAASQIYHELGVPVRGGSPKRRGTAILNGSRHRLPLSLFSLLGSDLLKGKAKLEAASLLFRLRSLKTQPFESMTIREWLDSQVRDERLRQVLAALVRLATYSADESQSAAAALEQLKLGMRGVIYVDEGWQKIVDGLHSIAVSAGVNFVTSSRVIGVDYDDAVRAVELGGLEQEVRSDTVSVALPDVTPESIKGTRLPVDTVLLAVDPLTASQLVGDRFARGWSQLKPVTIASLDVALSRLPQPKPTLAIGIDKPLYFSVHSAHAQLTPRGGALIHVAKYQSEPGAAGRDDYDREVLRLNAAARSDELELEALLDEVQPGWRDVLVHRRFFPALTVANSLRMPGVERPSPRTPVRGLYIAGDWVGSEGALSDAALASARAAARDILAS